MKSISSHHISTQKREKQHSKRTNNNSQDCRDQYTYRSRTDVEKQLEFSEYWHSEEKFYVQQILDDKCNRAKRCESYKVDFPKEKH